MYTNTACYTAQSNYLIQVRKARNYIVGIYSASNNSTQVISRFPNKWFKAVNPLYFLEHATD
jgi:hypothetical protein